MKYLNKSFPGAILLVVFLSAASPAFTQQSLTGNYTLKSGDVTLTLKLAQQGKNLKGTLSGSTGASFTLSGQVESGIGYGTCSGAEGTVFFEASSDGDDLTLSLVEADQFGAPDYNQAQYLQFKKTKTVQGGTKTGAVTGALGLGAGSTSTGNRTAAGSSGYQDTGSSGAASVGEDEVGDPSWGIKFGLPQGWIKQQNMEGAIVGHNTIAGMVLVTPHMAQDLQEMQAEMLQGIQEEGSYLSPSGGIEQVSGNVLAGEYSGIADGTQVKARGYGILSPNGGGAYLIAVTTPDMLGNELVGAAESMLNSVQFFKVDAGDLMQHFAGHWSRHSQHADMYMSFYPDGTYAEQTDISASGDFTDGAGNWTGGWSAAGGDKGQGRWTVRGNKDQGTIIVKMNDGNEYYYEYRVHIEDGYKYYNEYYFNGEFYHRSK